MSKPAPLIAAILALAATVFGVCFWWQRPESRLRRWYFGPRKPSKQDWVDWKPVGPDEAAKLKAQTGWDVQGYRHVIVWAEVAHARNRHGEGSHAKRKITDGDFLKIPFYIENAQRIMAGKKLTGTGCPAIRYEYTGPDGKTVVVEEIRTKRKKLAFKSMYKPG
jgi:hypothetical protein